MAKIVLTALTADQLAVIMKRTGSAAGVEEKIARDLADGAPTNEDGTIDAIEYAAWLLKERAEHDRPE